MAPGLIAAIICGIVGIVAVVIGGILVNADRPTTSIGVTLVGLGLVALVAALLFYLYHLTGIHITRPSH